MNLTFVTLHLCSDEQLHTLIRYMDPNADGDLTLEEIEEAIARAHISSEALEEERAVGKFVMDLDNLMAASRMR